MVDQPNNDLRPLYPNPVEIRRMGPSVNYLENTAPTDDDLPQVAD